MRILRKRCSARYEWSTGKSANIPDPIGVQWMLITGHYREKRPLQRLAGALPAAGRRFQVKCAIDWPRTRCPTVAFECICAKKAATVIGEIRLPIGGNTFQSPGRQWTRSTNIEFDRRQSISINQKSSARHLLSMPKCILAANSGFDHDTGKKVTQRHF